MIADVLEQMAIDGWQTRFLAAHLLRACLRIRRSRLYQEGDIMNLLTRWSKWSRVRSDDAINSTTGNGRVVVGQVRRRPRGRYAVSGHHPSIKGSTNKLAAVPGASIGIDPDQLSSIEAGRHNGNGTLPWYCFSVGCYQPCTIHPRVSKRP